MDTNVLLVPYTINPKCLDDVQRTYERLIREQRLIVPAQVAREFAKNRANKIGEVFQQLSRKRNRVDTLQVGRYPLLEQVGEYQRLLELEKEIDEQIREYRKTIGAVLDHIRGWRWNDPVSTLYRDLFSPAIIIDAKLSAEDLEKDLRRRNLNRIPPGFKDASKDYQGVGDLLIWHTILHLGRERKMSVIFVSGEEKTDWWHRSEGEALYPRFELVDEFWRASGGKSFHVAKFSQLLELFGAEEQVVEEVRKEETVHRAPESPRLLSYYRRTEEAETSVDQWLRNRLSPVELRRIEFGFPDMLLVLPSQQRMGVEVRLAGRLHPARVSMSFREVAYRAYYEINAGNFEEFVVVFVTEDENTARSLFERAHRTAASLGDKVGVVVGFTDDTQTFFPAGEYLPSEQRSLF